MPSLLFSLFCLSAIIMIPAILLQLFFGFGGIHVVSVKADYPFNNPPGVDIWCGKAYRETNSSFDPGGRLNPPSTPDRTLKLDLRIYPRYNLYLSSDNKASFIIDTPVQYVSGQRYENWTYDPDRVPSERVPFVGLILQLRNVQTSDILANWETKVPVNTTGNEVEFSLRSMPPASHAWTVSAIATSKDGYWSYYGGTTVTVLPERNDTGSAARIDHLHGGIEVQSSLTKNEWKHIYPFSFYTSWDWIQSTMHNASATKDLTSFHRNGYNLIHPVPPGGTDPFNHIILEEFLKICDDLELYVMYDMRHTYKNKTSITDQLSRLQHHPSLLLYYTADEPDGWCDPLNATELSYKHIKDIDPYHPVSLVLNCANFYFNEYSAGADIILEDTYPIATNTSFSDVYKTVCNTTYGDCGCDNCHANDPAFPVYTKNAFLDIIERTDNLRLYQEWLGRHAKKPVWGVPQAFYDRGSFWRRFPTKDEEAVMGMLRLNHGAKGIVAWIYPTSDEIEDLTSNLAKIITSEEVTQFTLGATRIANLAISGAPVGLLDATTWILSNRLTPGLAMICYVYTGYEAFQGALDITLPIKVGNPQKVLWGPGGWRTNRDGSRLRKYGLEPLEVGILLMSERKPDGGEDEAK